MKNFWLSRKNKLKVGDMVLSRTTNLVMTVKIVLDENYLLCSWPTLGPYSEDIFNIQDLIRVF